MSTHEEIRKSYKELGGSYANFYDGMITYTNPVGKLLNKIIWGFDRNSTDQWISGALAGIPDGFSGKLLEIPVGTGVITMPAYRKLPNASITCMDYSTDMMNNAKRRAKQMKIKNIAFRQGNVGDLPFADETFDIVLSLNGFHAFPDKEAAYSETFRVLKKGGIFCGCFYIQGEMKRTDFFVKHLLERKKSFSAPFETQESLNARLKSMYAEVQLHAVKAEGFFLCRK